MPAERADAPGGNEIDCLFDAGGLQLNHHPGRRDGAVVLFCEGAASGRMCAKWLRRTAGSSMDLYEVVPQETGVFPQAAMEELCAGLADVLSGPAVAVGAGHGARAALQFGRGAGCGAALVFSPRGLAEGASELSEPGSPPVDPPAHTLIAFDPAHRDDAAQFAALKAVADVRAAQLPLMSARTDVTLSAGSGADGVLKAMMEGALCEAARALRQSRAGDTGFLSRLSIACSQAGHPVWGRQIAEMVRPKHRDTPQVALARAEADAGLGRPLKAVETLEHLIVATPQSPRYWSLLADRYESMGHDGAAADVLELAMTVTENYGFCGRLIRKLDGLGSSGHARAHDLAETAVERWPERRAHIARLIQTMPPRA